MSFCIRSISVSSLSCPGCHQILSAVIKLMADIALMTVVPSVRSAVDPDLAVHDKHFSVCQEGKLLAVSDYLFGDRSMGNVLLNFALPESALKENQ